MTTQPSSDLIRGLARVLETGAHSDVLLVCANGTTYEAHKVILGAVSEFFSKALQPNTFKVSQFRTNVDQQYSEYVQEGRDNRIELVVGDSDTIKLMIDYIYTTTYDDTNFPEGAFTCHLKMIEVADFYAVPGLREKAWKNIQATARGPQTFPIHDFITALRFVYGTLTHEEEIKKHLILWIIQDSAHFIDDPSFGEVLSELPLLGKELTLKMLPGANQAKYFEKMGRVFCCQCRREFAMDADWVAIVCPYCGGDGS
ncbi:BTB/POZ-like protein [Venturia nashicola]|uniref:BTB/POZ-like protein n=1 Tax=Venturia nashicola TaxID=86259 RepID=A0A4Z1P1M6_9PEZI|nr:BTB/POZ-like protein [Venturia nashicola]